MVTKEKATTLSAVFMSCEAPCNMSVAKNTLQRRLMRNVTGGEGSAGLPSDGHKGDWVKRVQREMHCGVGGVSIERVQDLPEKTQQRTRGL